eukprot:356927-Chlamydomonas_euryale.AAC.1
MDGAVINGAGHYCWVVPRRFKKGVLRDRGYHPTVVSCGTGGTTQQLCPAGQGVPPRLTPVLLSFLTPTWSEARMPARSMCVASPISTPLTRTRPADEDKSLPVTGARLHGQR